MRKKKSRPMRVKTKRSDAIFRDVPEKSFAFVFGMLKFNDISTRHYSRRHCLIGYWPHATRKNKLAFLNDPLISR